MDALVERAQPQQAERADEGERGAEKDQQRDYRGDHAAEACPRPSLDHLAAQQELGERRRRHEAEHSR